MDFLRFHLSQFLVGIKMDFLSLDYAQFLIITAFVYWLLPNVQARLLVIVTASLVFYSFIQRQYVWLLLVMLTINFWLGKEIPPFPPPPQKKKIFKYFTSFGLGIFDLFLKLDRKTFI